MLYLGVDIHKKHGWVTLLDYFGQVAKPAQLAVEATFNRYYFLDLIEPLGFELHWVHPQKTKARKLATISFTAGGPWRLARAEPAETSSEVHLGWRMVRTPTLRSDEDTSGCA